jgi:hypothetical protein
MRRVKLTGREESEILHLADWHGDDGARAAAAGGWLTTREEGLAVIRLLDEYEESPGEVKVPPGAGNTTRPKPPRTIGNVRARVEAALGRSPYGLAARGDQFRFG